MHVGCLGGFGGGMVVVLCDRWPTWTTSAPTLNDAIWEAAAHAVSGQA